MKIFAIILITSLLIAGISSALPVSAASLSIGGTITPMPGQKGKNGQNNLCSPDLTKVATTLNVTVEQLKAALAGSTLEHPDLTATASKLGVSLDALKNAIQASRAANCPTPSGPQGTGQSGQANVCAPDLTKVATTLNVTVEKLKAALAGSTLEHPDLVATASRLGVTLETLKNAIQASRATNCPTPSGPQGTGKSGQANACAPDLTKVAAALNITVEKLKAALASQTQAHTDQDATAASLGVSLDAFKQAMQLARASGCPTQSAKTPK